MTKETITTQLKDLVQKAVPNKDISEINESTSLIEDLDFDSVSIVSLITLIEQYYQVAIDDEDLLIDAFDNFGTMVNSVYKLVQKVYE